MTKQNNTVQGTLVYKQFITLEDGTEVQVRYNQDKELYSGTDVTVYSYTATEGKGTERKEVTRYAVAVADAKRAARVTAVAVKDNMLADIASGMTATELLAKYSK